ncbi:hypothetical protein J4405_00915 [Candidatus Woesearchaeota archaeon]|nr:hypothetical protein [Candidatus Woesearchaeota archaeon]
MLKLYNTGNFLLAGRTNEDITRTLEHYKGRGFNVGFPAEDNAIFDSDSFVVFHMLPIADLTMNFLDIGPLNDVTFQVHPNAVKDLENQAQNYEKALRGGLYKLEPRRDLTRLPPLHTLEDIKIGCYFFLPKDVWEALREYDFSEFTAERLEYEGRRNQIKHPNLDLNPKIKRVKIPKIGKSPDKN